MDRTRDASKRRFEMKEPAPEAESPFLDEAAYDLPTREEAWATYEAEPELQSETPFASALVPAAQEYAGLAAEEETRGEIKPEAPEAPVSEPEEETGEDEREFQVRDVRTSHALHAKTWGGEFIVDQYAVMKSGDIGYGVDITIRFKPNKYVDAEKIAFVQTAQSMKDAEPFNRWDNDKYRKVAESRMIPVSKPGKGTHIDQVPYNRTPLYGMKGSRGNDLSDPQPDDKLTEIGCHYTDGRGKLRSHDAKLFDSTDLGSGDIYTAVDPLIKQEWRQLFETTALAIAGNQKGMYYGSVEWGWKKSTSDTEPQGIKFRTKSNDFPSHTFMEAARLWNASVTSENKETIDLPIGVPVTYKKNTPLWDSPDKRKKIADLAKDTRLGRTERLDPKQRVWWTNVIVVSGSHIGKTGWLQEADIYSLTTGRSLRPTKATREEVWATYEAKSELQPETPFASALTLAEQEYAGPAAEEALEGEIEPEALDITEWSPESEAEEAEDFTGGDYEEDELGLLDEQPLEERFDPSAISQDVADALAKKDWPLALKLAIQAGWRDENELTNLIFFARHPELPPEKLDPKDPKFKQLSGEWSKILDREVWRAIQASAENTALAVSGQEVTAFHRHFWGAVGKRFKGLVEDAATQVDINPGLLGTILLAETYRHNYLTSEKMSSYVIGVDDFYEARAAIRARVPAYAKIKWDKNQTPLVHDNDAKKNPRKVKTILFDSGPDALLATAVYVKFYEIRLREEAFKLNGDFDRLPVETRVGLTRMAMAAGIAGVTPLLKDALLGKDIFIRKYIPVKIYQTQRNATVRTAQAMHLSDWIFGKRLAAMEQELETLPVRESREAGQDDNSPLTKSAGSDSIC